MAGRDERRLAQILVEFSAVLTAEHTVRDVLDALGGYCTELLPVHGVGVLVAGDDGLEVATANTEVGRIVETLEMELAEGPCVDCVRSAEQVLVPDLAAVEDRYPRFAPRALEEGVRAVFAFPMSARTGVAGAVDIIAREPVELDATHLYAAQLLADVTVSYIANSLAHEEKSRLASQLKAALDSRVVIEQAKGVLAERHDESVDAAFDRLRRHARQTSRKLRDVAEAVLRGDVDNL